MFSLSCDYSVEDGYRNLEMLIYAPANYVGVLTKEHWDVFRTEDIEDWTDDGIKFKPGKDRIEGKSDWQVKSYHDSCWRSDGVKRTIREYSEPSERHIIVINTLTYWYQVVEMTEEKQEEFREAVQNRHNT